MDWPSIEIEKKVPDRAPFLHSHHSTALFSHPVDDHHKYALLEAEAICPSITPAYT